LRTKGGKAGDKLATAERMKLHVRVQKVLNYFAEMWSGSEQGHSTLGWRVIKKKRKVRFRAKREHLKTA